MKIKAPEYFTSFRCVADRCKDSCCIGWEIDIDDNTLKKYDSINTPLGEEIRDKTIHGHFPLEKNGRCAFLNGDGLCRIISELGDSYLCDICREHPRYYGVGNGCIEGGLGLGCEEAARVILALKSEPVTVETEREVTYFGEDEFAPISENLRKELYKDIFTLDINELIGKYESYAATYDEIAFDLCTGRSPNPIRRQPASPATVEDVMKTLNDGASLLSECEFLTEDWPKLMEKVKKVDTKRLLARDDIIRPLLYYFTHRYVREGIEDMTLGRRVSFALISSLTVVALSLVTDGEDKDVRAAVLYSKNIEYSTENIEYIMDNM